jgi:hypothetical protein
LVNCTAEQRVAILACQKTKLLLKRQEPPQLQESLQSRTANAELSRRGLHLGIVVQQQQANPNELFVVANNKRVYLH